MRSLTPPRSFELSEARALLTRTPGALHHWLFGLPEPWLICDEGENTFSPRDVVAHLIHGERHAWIERVELLLKNGGQAPFPPFDRQGYIEEARTRPLPDLLVEFSSLRERSLARLSELVTEETNLGQTAVHPSFGSVTLGELLSTWVVHDLTHIAQIARVLAHRYRGDVGPWAEYLGILHDRR